MSEVHKAKKVAAQKQETVKRIADLIKKYPIIGSVNMENLPAAQLQNMRSQLRNKVELLMAKRRIMKFAIEKAKSEKPGIEKIEDYLKGMPALLFTEENPFSLFKIIKKNKSKAPAKAGQIAPSDIVVKAGPTPFAPGPVIGELGALGIKTKVDAGKIAILSDAVVCKEGEEISANLAGMLTRLGIKPMEIGLDISAVYEDGNIFTKSVLDIDEDQFIADLEKAASWAFNLSVETAYPTDINKELLIQKAFRDAKALALSENILADAVVEEILAKAERHMLGLKSSIPDFPEAVKKEKPVQEAGKEDNKSEEQPKEIEEKKEEVKDAPAKIEEKKEAPKEEPKKEEKSEEAKKEEAEQKENKSAEKIVEEIKKEADNDPEVQKEKQEKKEAEKMEEVKDLTKELLKKGTLRK